MKLRFKLVESLENIVSLYTKFNLEYRIRFDREAVEPFVYTEQRLEFEFLVGGLNSHQSNKLIVQYSKGLCKVIEFKMNDIETNVSHEVTTLPSLLESNFGAYKTNSIVTTLKKHFFPIKNMVQDISFGQVYAIHPPVIREDTYKVGAPKLLTDGSGLASTLFELKHSENEIFQSIIEGMKLISSGIVGISVNYVESRQRIEVNTEICSNQSGGTNEVFPVRIIVSWNFEMVCAGNCYGVVKRSISNRRARELFEPFYTTVYSFRILEMN